jgi:colanic acid/amylovoran biosynthesis glycosyltransferase
MQHDKQKVQRIAFVVGTFPATSETFIINQVADLIDRGIDVRIFAFEKGDDARVSERYHTYRMINRVQYLSVPDLKILLVLKGIYALTRLLLRSPRAFFRVWKTPYSTDLSGVLKVACWTLPCIGQTFPVTHCHFGTIATKYLSVRSVLRERSKLITTFYGYDVSHTPKEKGMDCYADLIQECTLFLVMSENMKSRVLPLGVPEEKIEVHPISIDVDSYKFKERTLREGELIQITSVGRFVEKKGFDDLLRAIHRVKDKAKRPFKLNIVGDGELHDQIHNLAKELQLEEVVDFKGYMKLEEVFDLYDQSHFYVQASKTAKDGDME